MKHELSGHAKISLVGTPKRSGDWFDNASVIAALETLEDLNRRKPGTLPATVEYIVCFSPCQDWPSVRAAGALRRLVAEGVVERTAHHGFCDQCGQETKPEFRYRLVAGREQGPER